MTSAAWAGSFRRLQIWDPQDRTSGRGLRAESLGISVTFIRGRRSSGGLGPLKYAPDPTRRSRAGLSGLRDRHRPHGHPWSTVRVLIRKHPNLYTMSRAAYRRYVTTRRL